MSNKLREKGLNPERYEEMVEFWAASLRGAVHHAADKSISTGEDRVLIAFFDGATCKMTSVETSPINVHPSLLRMLKADF